MKTKKKSRTGLVKVSRLSNTRASHSDTRLPWIMLNKISAIYSDLKNKETLKESLKIQNLKSHTYFLPPCIYQPIQPRLPVKLQEVPSNLQDIQPQP